MAQAGVEGRNLDRDAEVRSFPHGVSESVVQGSCVTIGPTWTNRRLRVFLGQMNSMEHPGRPLDGIAEGEVVTVDRTFEDFFELEQDRLLRVLWMVTGSLQEAEDIVQETFLRVWERWPTVASMESPAGYLHNAAMNLFRNRYRRAKLSVRRAIGADPPMDAFEQADDRISVSSALGGLTPKQRAALVLTELLGYPTEEAGRLLGVRGSTVRSLTSNARAALRDAEEFADE